jgi:hypothetical protein
VPTWIRVRDTSTGAEYDVDQRSTLRPGVIVIEGYPPSSGPSARPRPAKPLVDKAGQPATPHLPGDDGADLQTDSNGPAEPADTTEEHES